MSDIASPGPDDKWQWRYDPVVDCWALQCGDLVAAEILPMANGIGPWWVHDLDSPKAFGGNYYTVGMAKSQAIAAVQQRGGHGVVVMGGRFDFVGADLAKPEPGVVVVLDHGQPETGRKLAGTIVQAWTSALSTGARLSLSHHDCTALAEMITGALTLGEMPELRLWSCLMEEE